MEKQRVAHSWKWRDKVRKVKAAAVQMKCCYEENVIGEILKDKASIKKIKMQNIENAEKYVRQAASEGANIVLLPELFELPYFCQEKNYDYYNLAESLEESSAVNSLRSVARELNVVLPVSFYEREVNNFYNSVAIIDADGEILGVYRKTHIPDDHFYQEKFYFTPGNTGFMTWETAYGRIGVGICWDQWFPEAARSMALLGAELLFYPTAIGSEPILQCDSMPHWRRCMQGHSASNIIPVIAANRVGLEKSEPSEANSQQKSSLTFYGSSFITDETGGVINEADRETEQVIGAEFDLDEIREMRQSWGVFRDRRPETYII